MHLYRNETEWFVGADMKDAVSNATKYYIDECGYSAEEMKDWDMLELELVPDDKVMTLVIEDAPEETATKTAAEWAAEWARDSELSHLPWGSTDW